MTNGSAQKRNLRKLDPFFYIGKKKCNLLDSISSHWELGYRF